MLRTQDGVRDDCLKGNEVLLGLVCAGQTEQELSITVKLTKWMVHEVFLNGFSFGFMGAYWCDLDGGGR